MWAIDDLTKRVAHLVRNYIEHVWPHLERAGGTPDEPMQDAKGSTNPPIGEWVHALLWSNRVASRYLSRELEIVKKGKIKASNGVHYSRVLMDLQYDAGLVQTWADKDPAMLQAFRETCRHVAKGVVLIRGTTKELTEMERRMNLDYDDPQAFVVRRNPTDEALQIIMPGEQPEEVEATGGSEMRGRTRRGQVIDTMHTRRLMVEQLEAVERSTGYRGLEAMEILSERKKREGKDWSVRKLRRAREMVNRERDETGDGDAA